MIAIFLSPLYVLFHIYLFIWLIRWLKLCNSVFHKRWPQTIAAILYILVACAMVVAFFLPHGHLRRIMKLVGNYWLGVLLYTVLVFGAALLIRLILMHSKMNQELLHSPRVFAIAGCLCIMIVVAISAWGVVNARIIRTTQYEVSVDKSAGDLSDLDIVLVADLHLGYNIGCRHMEQMVEKINAQDPDLVVMAGDIFDNEYEALDDPQKLAEILRGIKSRYGVYAVYGNHDISEKILAGFTFGSKTKKESDIRMDQLLADANITLLRDESVLIDNCFYLFGRADAKCPGRGIAVRKTPEEITADMDLSKPIIVLDHQPRQLQELADAGVDLDLCGHTHDGQLFPGNLTSKLMWENSYGYLKKGNMHNIVTSGVGLFGPDMRVGTIAEICNIKVHFEG